ncbi:probable cysteinyl-tRNA synthetase [Phialocephala subalpina]|uniref:cysteine--tRNA ligase n=1 Tax=Phialocephala subalpina TaxID=576137 RepID=A0A1L7XXA3_9HELO|nr:probable cysteinyl-tRNA synthetase [Phialocephala subalpina]
MAQLKVFNSLQPGAPVPFEPLEQGKVSWYACGPTVYDHSHLGHARNYVSTDIIRRIMLHYFGYNLKFVMNITDVDDKIILKARRAKLLELEKSKTYTESELSKLAATAFQSYAEGNLPELVQTDGPELSPSNYADRRDAAYGKVLAGGTLTGEGKPGDAEAKMKMHLSNLTAAAQAIQENKVFGGADEILLPYLDSLYKDSIDGKDHSIFTKVTQYWEAQFMEDMDNLNVLRPDYITRVTSYVPQIAKFVEKIVEKGFAYEADGSVYFDIAAFERAGNPYARLCPNSRNDKALQEEGEGSLSKNLGGKRGAGDFALWKKSKAGEPVWPSPWGEGRPGWHIECSVMASDILGSQMDIHSGGIDLAFPHHDNELAQSEAYFCSHGKEHHWVKYFFHMGHLSISGSKMSKSLKNFQTIKDALKDDYTPRGMRIVFLLGRWNDGVEISPDMRTMAEVWETTLNNFFTTAKSLITQAGPQSIQSLSINGTTEPTELQQTLQKAQSEMKSALSDSFDTPRAMRVISELVKEANIHINTHKSDMDNPGLEAITRWLTKMVGIFGLDANASPPYEGLGWTSSASGANLSPQEAVKPYLKVHLSVKSEVERLALHSEALDSLMRTDVDGEFTALERSGTKDTEALAMPYLRSVSRIRDELRRIAPSSDKKKEILALSDQIRDIDLTNLGVYLDDRSDQASLIKFVPKEELLAAREEKAAKEREKAAAKDKARLERERIEREKEEKAKVNPVDMFKDDRFSAWDEKGIPTKTKEGEDVTKSALKKMQKEWQKQDQVHQAWKAKSGL